jgi:hypothetical protein
VSLRPRLATALVGRDEDAADHNLPLLVWHGLIPVAEADPHALVDVAAAPDGLLDQLTEPQIRDLIAYLRHPVQVPLPECGWGTA